MPFAYYGAKHGLASRYQRPRFDTIVEPFADVPPQGTVVTFPIHRGNSDQ